MITNIDWHLQRIVEEALAQGIWSWGHGTASFPAQWSPRIRGRGAIVALASYPNLRSQRFRCGQLQARRVRSARSHAAAVGNRAIAAATPTGSTFKMVTGSAALTEGVVKVDQVVDDTGGWNCGGYYARDIAAGSAGHDVHSGARCL